MKEYKEDPPSRILFNGDKHWYNDEGFFHRVGAPAIITSDGYEEWYIDGELHREDGPAIIHSNGYQEWWLNGERHREDGPAVVPVDGKKEYFYHDKWMPVTSDEEFLRIVKLRAFW